MAKHGKSESGSESRKSHSLRDALNDIPTDDEQMEIYYRVGRLERRR